MTEPLHPFSCVEPCCSGSSGNKWRKASVKRACGHEVYVYICLNCGRLHKLDGSGFVSADEEKIFCVIKDNLPLLVRKPLTAREKSHVIHGIIRGLLSDDESIALLEKYAAQGHSHDCEIHDEGACNCGCSNAHKLVELKTTVASQSNGSGSVLSRQQPAQNGHSQHLQPLLA